MQRTIITAELEWSTQGDTIRGCITSARGYRLPDEIVKKLQDNGWLEWKDLSLVNWLGMYHDYGNYITKYLDWSEKNAERLASEISLALFNTLPYFPDSKVVLHKGYNGKRVWFIWELII